MREITSTAEILIEPLAFESFGVRAMATFVQTPDVSILLDPGTSLAPKRFGLRPHKQEYRALYDTRHIIQKRVKEAEIITVSHYHFDHYTPGFENYVSLWSTPQYAGEMCANKIVLAKDRNNKINYSQRKRAYYLYKLAEEKAEKFIIADDNKVEFGGTTIQFSQPVFHGQENTKLGYVLMTMIKTENEKLLHAPDIQGPFVLETLKKVLDTSPDLLILGGPPTYLGGFKVSKEALVKARNNMVKIAEKIPQTIIEHHLLRDMKYKDFLKPVLEVAETRGNQIMTAAELIGQEPLLLEARRRELHEKHPVPKEWYEKLERGEFSSGFGKVTF